MLYFWVFEIIVDFKILFLIFYFTEGPKNNIYALLDYDDLWEYDMIAKTWTSGENGKFRRLFPNLVNGVRGGVRCDKNLTWFFKG